MAWNKSKFAASRLLVERAIQVCSGLLHASRCQLGFVNYQRVSIASYVIAGIARAEMSVRHTPVLYQNEESYRHDFFTIREPEHSIF